MERLFNLDPQLIHDAVLLMISVLVMFTFLSYLLFNPAREFLKKRQDKIRDDIDSAKKDKEEAAALKADYDAISIIGQNIRNMGGETFQRLVFQFMFYRYYNYDLDEPFLPQFLSNLEKLKELTGG